MFTFAQSARIRGSAGEPLPVVWPGFAEAGMIFRRGALTLVCAPPGIGKSAFTLNYGLQSRTPTMYFSADSDAFTQLTRSIAIVAGMPLEESVRGVLDGQVDGYVDVLQDIPMRLNYSASPSLDEIEDHMEAYAEVFEDYPSLVIVDNVTNVRIESAEGSDRSSNLEELMDWLHTMARDTQSCVMGLHHVTGPYNSGTKPIPLDGIKNQIGRVPEQVLTLHKAAGEYGEPDELRVSAVKNRFGVQDTSGETFVSLPFVGDTMKLIGKAKEDGYP